MGYLYFLSTDDADLELAQAELWALTGCEAEGRIGLAPVACDISRSAYVGVCAELLAHGSSLEELCAGVRDAGVVGDGFRIEVRKMPPKVAVGSPEIARHLADAMRGFPDLDKPRERYLALCREGSWRFGRVLSEIDRGYLRQGDRPHNFSQSLNARHARALVNMIAAPGDTLLDPCCGVGTCLIEARLMGIRAVGCDISKANAFNAAANLAHLGLPRIVAVADARHVAGAFDAALIDFPYGHTTRVDASLYREILNNIAPRALRLGVITGQPAEDLFASLSLQVLRCARVRARRLVRHFYVVRGGKG